MKLLSLICVIIVLVLNFVPCADAQESRNQSTSFTHHHSESKQNHPVNDNCSPFCHCACCASSSVVQLLSLGSVPYKEYKNTMLPYFTGKYIDISLPVWQPPRLS